MRKRQLASFTFSEEFIEIFDKFAKEEAFSKSRFIEKIILNYIKEFKENKIKNK